LREYYGDIFKIALYNVKSHITFEVYMNVSLQFTIRMKFDEAAFTICVIGGRRCWLFFWVGFSHFKVVLLQP